MTAEDLQLIEQAGRRCASCHSGRNWRRFEVLRPAGRDAIVTCQACRPRLMTAISAQEPASTPMPAPAETTTAAARGAGPARPPHRQRDDRAKRNARGRSTNGTHASQRGAKAGDPKAAGPKAGAPKPEDRNAQAPGQADAASTQPPPEAAAEAKQQSSGSGPVTEKPAKDLAAAFDRLESQTRNLRIVRPRSGAR